MGNFETKHPRARDGKFTEKYREEADMELTWQDQHAGEIYSLVPTEGREKVEEVYNDDPDSYFYGELQYVEFKNPAADKGRTDAAYTHEYYYQNGNVEERRYLDSNHKVIRNKVDTPASEEFFESGSTRRISYDVSKEYAFEFINRYGGKGATEKKHFPTRKTSSWVYWIKHEDGKFREVTEIFRQDGSLKKRITHNDKGAADNPPGGFATEVYDEKGRIVRREDARDGHKIGKDSYYEYWRRKDLENGEC